ncbi:hypothetical protein [Leifsonia aquatica]|uniref:hypothetical protein n=1 Tax=Leifsonia aquatica TaxID=144185 RepID=UPI0037F11FFF
MTAGTPTTAVATPSPSPTPTRASAPSSRVPADCDTLVPATVVADAFRVDVESATVATPRSPASYADERAGVLTCRWASGPVDQAAADRTVYAWVTVVPGATRDDLENELAGSMMTEHQPLSVASDSYSSCSPSFFQWCGFVSYAPSYSVIGGVWDYGDATFESQSTAIDALASASIPAVRALPSPQPLWQPQGATLRGASDCDGILTADQIASATGWSGSHVFRADDGENASSSLRENARVGSYYCAWSSDDSHGLSASVLPGGATYATASRPAEAVDVQGVGDSAYRTADTIDVIASGAWVQVSVSADVATEDILVALAKQELANVGYAG